MSDPSPTEPTPREVPPPPAFFLEGVESPPGAPRHRALDDLLPTRNENTRRAYRSALTDFARRAGAPSPDAGVTWFLALGPAYAARCAEAYVAALVAAKASPATVNRNVVALRSVVRSARLGWSLEVRGVRHEPYRDTRGPTWGDVVRLREASSGASGPRRVRDAAIVRLLTDLALRRAEVVSLDVGHVDATGERPRLWVAGKGRGGERVALTLPATTYAALRAWMLVRAAEIGAGPGALFVSFRARGRAASAMTTRRIAGSDVYRVVREAARAAGLEQGGVPEGARPRRQVRPHGLRHAAITRALEVRNGNVSEVRRFSRHADVRTVELYDDNRADVAGEIATELAE